MSPSKWLVNNFPGWAALNRAERSAIRDFPVLWSIFELAATNTRANPQSIIAAVAALHTVPASSIYDDAIDHYSDRYLSGANAAAHRQGLRLDQNHWIQHVEPALSGTLSAPRDKLLALLLITNRLRNNFLHGTKATYNFTDQLQNFRHANRVLMAAKALWP